MTTPTTLNHQKTCSHTPHSEYLVGNGVVQWGTKCQDKEEKPHYFIRPFKDKGGTLSWLESFSREMKWLCRQREAQQTLIMVGVNLAATLLLLSWCHSTRSMALMAYTYLSWFSLLSLITCLVYVWAEGQRATQRFTFGYQRCEVLAVFASVMLSLLGAVIIVKECIERFIQPEVVQTGMLTSGGVVGLVIHLGMTSLSRNPPLTQILRASQSSLLQEHVADMCQSLCSYIPSLKRILLPRVDPLVLISLAGFLAILADHVVLQIYNYHQADNVAAMVIALLTIATMFPLCVCSATLLLQTTPPSTFTQLDKSLREALTLDGVLEFRHEKFWALGVDDPSHRGAVKSTKHPSGFMLTGSLHVRVRRDANEQKVLAHVRERLLPVVPLLTVQVFKDDWTRSATTLQLLNDSARTLATSPSHSPHYVNVTYPQVYTPKPTPNLPMPPSPYIPPRLHPHHLAETPRSYGIKKYEDNYETPRRAYSDEYEDRPYETVRISGNERKYEGRSYENTRIPFNDKKCDNRSCGSSQTPCSDKKCEVRSYENTRIPYNDQKYEGRSYKIARTSYNDTKRIERPCYYSQDNTLSPEHMESHTHRISSFNLNGESVQSQWMVGKELYIPRDGHSPKPSPHYVNVDFSSRSGILGTAAVETGVEISSSSSSR